MSLLEEAIQIAVSVHAGERDKGGDPYILHPLRVMLRFEDEDDRIVAVLHDVIEHNPPLAFKIARVFPVTVLEALTAITRNEGEEYKDYVKRCGRNPLARRVKIADIRDNSNEDRLLKLPAAIAGKLRLKYTEALLVLGER